MERGDFHGEETLVLENEHLRVEVLATAGPQIVRVQLAGSSENVLGEVPDVCWDTPWGRYRLRGGHRLWFAPENPPLTSAPDEGGRDGRNSKGSWVGAGGTAVVGSTSPDG